MGVSVNLLLCERNVDCIWISTVVRTLSANVTHRPVETKLNVLIGRNSSRQAASTPPPAPCSSPYWIANELGSQCPHTNNQGFIIILTNNQLRLKSQILTKSHDKPLKICHWRLSLEILLTTHKWKIKNFEEKKVNFEACTKHLN